MLDLLATSKVLKQKVRKDGMGIALIELQSCNLFMLIRFQQDTLLESKSYIKTFACSKTVLKIAKKDFLKWKYLLFFKLDNKEPTFDEISLSLNLNLQ